jgi:nucleotide-binding universal stress UspA family protein
VQIVVGLTDRPESRAALDHAIEEARQRSASLHIVRTTGQVLNENPGKARDWADAMAGWKDEGHALVRRLADEGIDATFEVDPASTDPAEVLLNAGKERDADLIVIGLRRRSPVGKLLLGSVSQTVILQASCPVLTVKDTESLQD